MRRKSKCALVELHHCNYYEIHFLHPLFNLNAEDKDIVYCLYQNFKAH